MGGMVFFTSFVHRLWKTHFVCVCFFQAFNKIGFLIFIYFVHFLTERSFSGIDSSINSSFIKKTIVFLKVCLQISRSKNYSFLSFGKFVRSVNFFFVISSLYSLSFFLKIDCLKKDNSLNDPSRSSIVRFFLNHAIVHIKNFVRSEKFL